MPLTQGVRRLLACTGYLMIAFLGAEICARLDDWFFRDVPVLSTPSADNLFYVDPQGIKRGRPNASYRRVHLNSRGLLGPDVADEPAPGCRRWLFLGASETFGQVSAGNGGYPGLLRQRLLTGRCTEVINGAFPAMNLPQMINFYDSELVDLHPTTVFIYAPTHFYLSPVSKAPSELRAGAEPSGTRRATSAFWEGEQSVFSALARTRLVERLRSSAELPAPIQRLKWHQIIDGQLAALAPSPLFATVPAERLADMTSDLTRLIRDIRRSGAEPILITHALRAADPPRPTDAQDLLGMRVYVPQATETVLAAFEYAAAQRTRDVASREHVRLVDAAAAFSGRRELFIDLVHYSPEGELRLAKLIERDTDR